MGYRCPGARGNRDDSRDRRSHDRVLLAHPLFHDDNNGRQIVGRVELRPVAGLIIGGSGARGPFVSETAARGAVGDGHDREFTQTAWGADLEYSRGYYMLRYEGIFSAWEMPLVRAPCLRLRAPRPLHIDRRSLQVLSRFYAAARGDHLGFSEMTGSAVRGRCPGTPTSRVSKPGSAIPFSATCY